MNPTTYTVQKGDTLNAIASKYGFSNYKQAGITGYGADPNLIQPGQVLTIGNYKAPTQTVTPTPAAPPVTAAPISAATIQNPTAPINIGVAPSSITSVAPDIQSLLVQNYNTAETGVSTATTAKNNTLSSIEQLYQKLGTKSSEKARLEQEAGIPGLNEQITELNAQMTSVDSQTKQQLLYAQGQGGLGTQVNAATAEIARQGAIRMLPLSAAASALTGQLALAQDKVSKALEAEFEPVNAQIEYYKTLLQDNYETLSSADKKRADAYNNILAEYKLEQENARADKQQIYQVMLEAAKNGADNQTINAILGSTSPDGALRAAGQFLQEKTQPKPFDFVSATQYQPGGYFDPNTGKFVQTSPAGGGGGGGGSGSGGLGDIARAVVSNPSLFYNFTPTQKAQIISELQAAGYDVSKLQNSKLSSSQQDDVANMNTVSGLIDQVLTYNNDGTLEGIGAYGVGTLKQLGAQAGLGSEEGKSVRALIGNIQGTIAKLRGGTSFTPNEQKLLETYTPTINDSPAVALNKLGLLQKFIQDKNNNLLNAANQNITTGQIKKPEDTKTEDLRAKYGY